MDNNSPFKSDNQFVLSYEVLSLLLWITEHDTARLKKMIAHALKSGLKEEITRFRQLNDNDRALDAQTSVIEFFGLLEALTLEVIHEHHEETAAHKDLMPILEHIDTTLCDTSTVRASVERTAAQLSSHPQDNPEQALFKELLKRWKPSKKSLLN